ncbi:hypothetical protein NUW58_g7542 [Xylaria curta]|uniref:Uncharacterized protein n=1 Tax=Xylaria curta TaxID=42375 RepID=A0ACC1NHB1_9PEZI|nr:hypothetical protein NUW58_g7542 [Xylaria curta]
MHYPTTATLLTFAGLFATGSAMCYTTGTDGNFGKELDAVNGIFEACFILQGTYNTDERRTVCINDNTGTKWRFELKNISGGYRFIGSETCMSGMSKEARGCKRGGYNSDDNWQYTADPNTESCESD